MKVLFIDPIGGIAGDMLCAALIDAGLEEAQWRSELAKIPLPSTTIAITSQQRGVFQAKHVHILNPSHEDGNQAHHHDHGPTPVAWDHTHRSWKDIRKLITEAPLQPLAKERALKVFQALAEAEAHIHGQRVEDVHFHEVGAIDSILDIVGFCIATVLLGVERIYCAPPPLSDGEIFTAHGRTPLPAPATLKLLEGWTTRRGYFNHEQVTPTGAAIIKALATPSAFPAMTIDSSGYGAGTRDPKEYPNLLRVTLGTAADTAPSEDVIELQCNIDDMSPEQMPIVFERLFENGALDVFSQPILMKKGRMGTLLTVLTPLESLQTIRAILFRHTTTFGFRYISKRRFVLERNWETVSTQYGEGRLKIGRDGNTEVQCSVEYEDALALAAEHNVPLEQIYRTLLSSRK